MRGATGPERLRASLCASAARGTAWLARGAAPLATVGAPLPPALLGGELAEVAGDRLRALLRGETPVPAPPTRSPRATMASVADAASRGRTTTAGAAPDAERVVRQAWIPAAGTDGALAGAATGLAPAADMARRPAPPRPGSLAAAVRGYWAARAGEGAPIVRAGIPLAPAALGDARDQVPAGQRDAPEADAPRDRPLPSTAPVRPAPAAVAHDAGASRATLRPRPADASAPLPARTAVGAAGAALPAAWDDTLADALADVLREQAVRDGVTLAW